MIRRALTLAAILAALALLYRGDSVQAQSGVRWIISADGSLVTYPTRSVKANLVGNVTGNVTGDVTGNVSGGVSGHILDAAFVTPVNAVAATATVAYTGTNVAVLTAASYAFTYTDANIAAANDTVIITDGVTPKTYKFVAAVADEGDVLIAAGDPDATIANLVCALNHSGCTENTDYKAAAQNPLVSATADTAGAGTGTLTLTARTSGAGGNSVGADGTFAGAAFFPDHALEGGLDPEQVVLGSQTYTFVTTVAADYEVKKGTDADDSATNLTNAINRAAAPGVGDNQAGGKYMAPVVNATATGSLDTGTNEITLTCSTKGAAGNSSTLTAAGPQYSVTDAFSDTPSGVDGTVGAKGDVRFDTGFIYLCTAANSVSDANWKKAALSSY